MSTINRSVNIYKDQILADLRNGILPSPSIIKGTLEIQDKGAEPPQIIMGPNTASYIDCLENFFVIRSGYGDSGEGGSITLTSKKGTSLLSGDVEVIAENDLLLNVSNVVELTADQVTMTTPTVKCTGTLATDSLLEVQNYNGNTPQGTYSQILSGVVNPSADQGTVGSLYLKVGAGSGGSTTELTDLYICTAREGGVSTWKKFTRADPTVN